MTLQQVQSLAPTEKLPPPAEPDASLDAAESHSDSDPPVEAAAPVDALASVEQPQKSKRQRKRDRRAKKAAKAEQQAAAAPVEAVEQQAATAPVEEPAAAPIEAMEPQAEVTAEPQSEVTAAPVEALQHSEEAAPAVAEEPRAAVATATEAELDDLATRDTVIEAVERREKPRVAVSVGVGFRSDSNFYTGFTEDISEGGLFIATHMLRPIGSELQIICALPTGPEISVRGIVRWLRDPHDYITEAPPGMGVQFQDLAPEDLARIKAFVAVREPLFYEA